MGTVAVVMLLMFIYNVCNIYIYTLMYMYIQMRERGRQKCCSWCSYTWHAIYDIVTDSQVWFQTQISTKKDKLILLSLLHITLGKGILSQIYYVTTKCHRSIWDISNICHPIVLGLVNHTHKCCICHGRNEFEMLPNDGLGTHESSSHSSAKASAWLWPSLLLHKASFSLFVMITLFCSDH